MSGATVAAITTALITAINAIRDTAAARRELRAALRALEARDEELRAIEEAAGKHPGLRKGEARVVLSDDDAIPTVSRAMPEGPGALLLLLGGLIACATIMGCATGTVRALPETETRRAAYGVRWPEDASRKPEDYLTYEVGGRMVTVTLREGS